MFVFHLKETQIYQAVKWSKLGVFGLARVLSKVFFFLLIFDLLLFLYGFLGGQFSDSSNSILLGFFLIFFTLSIWFWLESSFFEFKLKIILE